MQKTALSTCYGFYAKIQTFHNFPCPLFSTPLAEGTPAPSLDEVVRATNEEVTAENRRLQGLCTSLQEAHHAMTLRVAQLQDAVNSRDTENAELKNQIDDLQYELMKVWYLSNTYYGVLS